MTSSKKPQVQEETKTLSNKSQPPTEADALFDDLSSFLEEGIKAIEESVGDSSLSGSFDAIKPTPKTKISAPKEHPTTMRTAGSTSMRPASIAGETPRTKTLDLGLAPLGGDTPRARTLDLGTPMRTAPSSSKAPQTAQSASPKREKPVSPQTQPSVTTKMSVASKKPTVQTATPKVAQESVGSPSTKAPTAPQASSRPKTSGKPATPTQKSTPQSSSKPKTQVPGTTSRSSVPTAPQGRLTTPKKSLVPVDKEPTENTKKASNAKDLSPDQAPTLQKSASMKTPEVSTSSSTQLPELKVPSPAKKPVHTSPKKPNISKSSPKASDTIKDSKHVETLRDTPRAIQAITTEKKEQAIESKGEKETPQKLPKVQVKPDIQTQQKEVKPRLAPKRSASPHTAVSQVPNPQAVADSKSITSSSSHVSKSAAPASVAPKSTPSVKTSTTQQKEIETTKSSSPKTKQEATKKPPVSNQHTAKPAKESLQTTPETSTSSTPKDAVKQTAKTVSKPKEQKPKADTPSVSNSAPEWKPKPLERKSKESSKQEAASVAAESTLKSAPATTQTSSASDAPKTMPAASKESSKKPAPVAVKKRPDVVSVVEAQLTQQPTSGHKEQSPIHASSDPAVQSSDMNTPTPRSSPLPAVTLLGVFILGLGVAWLFSEIKDIALKSKTALAPVKQNVSILETSGKRQFKSIRQLRLQLQVLTQEVSQLKQRVQTERKTQTLHNQTQEKQLATHTQSLTRLHQRERLHTRQLSSLDSYRNTLRRNTLPTMSAAIARNKAGLSTHMASTQKRMDSLDKREVVRFVRQQRTNRSVSTSLNTLTQTDVHATKRINRLVAYTRTTNKRLHNIDQLGSKHTQHITRLFQVQKPLPKKVAVLIRDLKKAEGLIRKLGLQSDARSWMFTRVISEIKPVQKGQKKLSQRLLAAKARIVLLENIAKNHRLVVANVSSTLPSAMQLLKTLSTQVYAQEKKINALHKKLKQVPTKK